MQSGGALGERIRAALADEPSTREVPMFGALAFMLNEKMVVALDKGADLIVRVDPQLSRDLLTRPGARPPEMGKGRAMGLGWLVVGADALTDETLSFWIGVALDYNSRTTSR